MVHLVVPYTQASCDGWVGDVRLQKERRTEKRERNYFSLTARVPFSNADLGGSKGQS